MNSSKPGRREVLGGLAAMGAMRSWHPRHDGLAAETKPDTIDVGFMSGPTASHRQSYLRHSGWVRRRPAGCRRRSHWPDAGRVKTATGIALQPRRHQRRTEF